jgi:hypothetical protein
MIFACHAKAATPRSASKNGALFRFVPAVAVKAMRTVPGIKTHLARREKPAIL